MICCDFYDDPEGTHTGSYKAFLVALFQIQKNALDQSHWQGNFHLQFGNICSAISYFINNANYRPYPKHTESESLGMGQSILISFQGIRIHVKD